jgi:hypothetical protein
VYYNTDKDDQALAKFKKWQLIFRELRALEAVATARFM